MPVFPRDTGQYRGRDQAGLNRHIGLRRKSLGSDVNGPNPIGVHIMPIVTVQLTREGTEPGVDHVTPEQKAAIFKGMSQVLLDVLGKPLDWTWVVFQEVEL